MGYRLSKIRLIYGIDGVYETEVENSLYSGIKNTRYETCLLTGNCNGTVRYINKIGSNIIEQYGEYSLSTDINDIFIIWLKYPISMIFVYWNHLMAFLDLRFGDIIIPQSVQRSFFLLFLSLIYWYLFAINMKILISEKKTSIKIDFTICMLFIAMLIPSLAQMMGYLKCFLGQHYI